MKSEPDNQEYLEIIKNLVPQLIQTIDDDLHRFAFKNIISTVKSFQEMFEMQDTHGLQIVTKNDFATIHRMLNKFIVQYIEKNKQEITGTDYANLIGILHFASENGFIGVYEKRTLDSIIQTFLKDHAELYYFNTKEILQLFKGFDSITPVLGETAKEVNFNIK